MDLRSICRSCPEHLECDIRHSTVEWLFTLLVCLANFQDSKKNISINLLLLYHIAGNFCERKLGENFLCVGLCVFLTWTDCSMVPSKDAHLQILRKNFCK